LSRYSTMNRSSPQNNRQYNKERILNSWLKLVLQIHLSRQEMRNLKGSAPNNYCRGDDIQPFDQAL
jgi:hypothetical protein